MISLFNRILLAGVFGFLLLPAAKAQSFAWAQAINGLGGTHGAAVEKGTTDTTGNLYSIGTFSGTASFGGGASIGLTARSQHDMFIMKQDSLGNLIWVKQIEGLSSGSTGCFGNAINVDAHGNIFITGFFNEKYDFDPGPAVHMLDAPWGDDAFILKLNASGNFVWARTITAGNAVYPRDIHATAAKLDKNGYLCISLFLYAGHGTTVDVDPGPGVKNIYFQDGNILLEKLDNNGNLIWANPIHFGNGSVATPTALALDSSSNVVMSGNFSGSADFDPSPAVHMLMSYRKDIFVVKYDSAGHYDWVKQIEGFNNEATANAIDRFGNVLLTGSFGGGTVDFDPGSNVYNVSTSSVKGLFTLRLNKNGDFSWVRTAGVPAGTHSGTAIATDQAGNVYTAVRMSDSCDLDPGPGIFNIPSGSALIRLDSSGNFVWGAGFDADLPSWIGPDKKSSIYITGTFSGVDKDFDPGPDSFYLSDQGSISGFILKLNQTSLPTGIKKADLQTADVSVYPNPSSGIITFAASSAIKRIIITDLTGKVVWQGQPGSPQTTVNLGEKAAGVYFYEVECEAGIQKGKLVVY